MKLLIADDHEDYCASLSEWFAQQGWHSIVAHTTDEALSAVAQHAQSLDLVLLDIEFHGEQRTGMEVLELIRRRYPHLPVVMISGKGTFESAVRATKLGAENFIDKATLSNERLLEVVHQAARSTSTNGSDAEACLSFLRAHGIIAQTPIMVELAQKILRIARSQLNVLITGETGTGKRLVAQAIHAASPRKNFPFITVDIPNIPRELFQSEMFGHVRGAFTGAAQDKRGFFHAANRGTLFLDEIGDLARDLQSSLLIPIEEKTFHRVGSNENETVDIRFISATDHDLAEAVRQGLFREQLYYRLRETEIIIPPLRERRDDIPLIAQHTLAKLNEGAFQQKVLTPAAINMLTAQQWPGNVRQLLSVVKESFMLAGDNAYIEERHIASALQSGYRINSSIAVDSLEAIKANAEKTAIEEALATTNGNVTKAAALLGVSRETVYNHCRRFNIDPHSYRQR
jgi:DNA-binding NtrC family response regulator